MDVEAAAPWRVEDRLRQDQAVRRHHGDVGVERRERGLRLAALERYRPRDRDAERLGALLDG